MIMIIRILYNKVSSRPATIGAGGDGGRVTWDSLRLRDSGLPAQLAVHTFH